LDATFITHSVDIKLLIAILIEIQMVAMWYTNTPDIGDVKCCQNHLEVKILLNKIC